MKIDLPSVSNNAVISPSHDDSLTPNNQTNRAITKPLNRVLFGPTSPAKTRIQTKLLEQFDAELDSPLTAHFDNLQLNEGGDSTKEVQHLEFAITADSVASTKTHSTPKEKVPSDPNTTPKRRKLSADFHTPGEKSSPKKNGSANRLHTVLKQLATIGGGKGQYALQITNLQKSKTLNNVPFESGGGAYCHFTIEEEMAPEVKQEKFEAKLKGWQAREDDPKIKKNGPKPTIDSIKNPVCKGSIELHPGGGVHSKSVEGVGSYVKVNVDKGAAIAAARETRIGRNGEFGAEQTFFHTQLNDPAPGIAQKRTRNVPVTFLDEETPSQEQAQQIIRKLLNDPAKVMAALAQPKSWGEIMNDLNAIPVKLADQ